MATIKARIDILAKWRRELAAAGLIDKNQGAADTKHRAPAKKKPNH